MTFCALCGTTQAEKEFPCWTIHTGIGWFCSKCGEFNPKILKEKMIKVKPVEFKRAKVVWGDKNWHLSNRIKAYGCSARDYLGSNNNSSCLFNKITFNKGKLCF